MAYRTVADMQLSIIGDIRDVGLHGKFKRILAFSLYLGHIPMSSIHKLRLIILTTRKWLTDPPEWKTLRHLGTSFLDFKRWHLGIGEAFYGWISLCISAYDYFATNVDFDAILCWGDSESIFLSLCYLYLCYLLVSTSILTNMHVAWSDFSQSQLGPVADSSMNEITTWIAYLVSMLGLIQLIQHMANGAHMLQLASINTQSRVPS